MPIKSIQAAIDRGFRTAARCIGLEYQLFRPRGSATPTAPRNRLGTVNAFLYASQSRFSSAAGVKSPYCWGVFDGCVVHRGDYLVSPTSIYFIGAEKPLEPPLCVWTNAIVSLARPIIPQPGQYGGLVLGQAPLLLDRWPATLLSVNARITGDLPETHFGLWQVMLPMLPVPPAAGDVLIDDMQRNFLVSAAEMTALGWQLTARQVAG
jgi:hypothetical protein